MYDTVPSINKHIFLNEDNHKNIKTHRDPYFQNLIHPLMKTKAQFISNTVLSGKKHSMQPVFYLLRSCYRQYHSTICRMTREMYSMVHPENFIQLVSLFTSQNQLTKFFRTKKSLCFYYYHTSRLYSYRILQLHMYMKISLT